MKTIFIILLLFITIKADEFCSYSAMLINGKCLSIEDISKTSGNVGHVSSIFYGLGSGFNSVAGVLNAVDNSSLKLSLIPSSVTILSAGTMNQIVKIRRRQMMKDLGVSDQECKALLITGTTFFISSVAVDVTYNVLLLQNNYDIAKAVGILNSTLLTSSFIVNIIGKVVQAKELDRSAVSYFEKRKIAVSPYIHFMKNVGGAGLVFNF